MLRRAFLKSTLAFLAACPFVKPAFTYRTHAFLAQGDRALVLADGRSGKPIATYAGPIGAPFDLGDIAFDRAKGRAFVWLLNDERLAGSVATFEIGASTITRVVNPNQPWIDGNGTLAVSSLGLVIFEDASGARWRLVGDDGVHRPSWPAPMPHGAYVDGTRVRALTQEVDGTWATRELDLETMQGTITPIAAQSADAWLVPSSDRIVHGRDVIVTDQGHVARLKGAALVVDFADGATTEVTLPSEPSRWAHALVDVGGGRVLVATNEGVLAFEVDTMSHAIVRDDAFDGHALFGPLAVVDP